MTGKGKLRRNLHQWLVCLSRSLSKADAHGLLGPPDSFAFEWDLGPWKRRKKFGIVLQRKMPFCSRS